MKLKSCPFCADIHIRITKTIHLYEDISYQAMCLHCGATAGHPRMTKEAAIKAWNTRVHKVCKCTDQCGYDLSTMPKIDSAASLDPRVFIGEDE